MKKSVYVFLFAVASLVITGCSKNYYSGSGKGSSCGCPSKKGMVGY